MSIALRPSISTTTVEDGMILLDEDTGRYWQLNPTGAAVLEALLHGASPTSAARHLTRQHTHLSLEQAEHDVTALLASLRTAHLVTP